MCMKLYLSVLLLAIMIVHQTYARELLIKHDGLPADALVELFYVLTGTVMTLDEMHVYAQAHFLRPTGIERWHMEVSVFEPLKDKLIPLLDALGMIQQENPSQEAYDIIIIFGATASGMRGRLGFAQKCCYEQLCNSSCLVFLTSERPRFDDIETASVIFNKTIVDKLPEREIEIAHILVDDIITNALVRDRLQFVATNLIIEPSGSQRRANTFDTIVTWLSQMISNEQMVHRLQSVSILAISDNPHIVYQDAVLRSALGCFGLSDYTLETVGRAAEIDHPLSLAVMLDALARTLYVERFNYQNGFVQKEISTQSNSIVQEFYPKSMPVDA